VSQLVLATKAHGGTLHADAPLLVDIDLSILGQLPGRFWEYEEQIRREYDWVSVAVFCQKRAEILEGFLERGRIYLTDVVIGEREALARENLRTSVARLKRRSFWLANKY
jgi:predicted metal-dependent HD superfamily phosphohydrolase